MKFSPFVAAALARQEATAGPAPLASRAALQRLCQAVGVRPGARCDEAADYLSYSGDIVTFTEPALRPYVVLDPQWLCYAFAFVARSDMLAAAGGCFESTALSAIWPLYEVPGDAYSFLIALFKHFGLMHELRLGKDRATLELPPFSANSVAQAFVVPCLLAPSSTFRAGSLLSDTQGRAPAAATIMMQRQYTLPALPERLRLQLLFRLMDVTSVHAQVWQAGLICGQLGGADVLVAEWKQEPPLLRLMFVSKARASMVKFVHIIITTVEELLVRWFPSRDYVSCVISQNGSLRPVNELVVRLLQTHDERDLLALAPDLLVQQGERVDAAEFGPSHEIGAGSFGTIELVSWKVGARPSSRVSVSLTAAAVDRGVRWCSRSSLPP